ncbi:LysM peptidoglycan-binding domain-containing protein [Pararhodonellum marinum]|uniref:LysM peptidoglycan-binding domain-containing protein n=1 Tax=Pararhodonellum marinum TaxID=2755358 RepID=UPI00188E777F|nr:LysM peptidoglycan-binding domain-containing protein [Pararhodonellum marinum]
MKRIALIFGFMAFGSQLMAFEMNAMDSVGIEKVGDQTFIIHQVEPKETMFAISRRYQAPMNDIIQNNDLKDGLKIGQRLRIPFIPKTAVPQGAKLHKVNSGETLYSVAKSYNVKVEDLMAWNDLKGTDISVGQPLIIQGVATQEETPTVAEVKETAQVVNQQVAVVEEVMPETKSAESPVPASTDEAGVVTIENPQPEWFTHTVSQGETLFAIAKKYDAKIEDLINWNALTSNNLVQGQNLKVGKRGGVVPSRSTQTEPSVNEGLVINESPEKPASTEFKNIKEMGLAEVIEGTGNHKKYLVLHRTAPVGTIMRIRNEENDITIFARVVGKIPETGDNNRLVIKVSKAAYDQLRAVNSRFPVEISY